MKKDKKIFVIAGEVSGDILGADLIKSIKKKDLNTSFYGVGGEEMEKISGFTSLFDIKDISVMGLIEVLKRIFLIKSLIKKTVNEILKIKPDLIVTIDAPGFNKAVVKAVRKKLPDTKFVHYVAPQVWAWKEERAKTIAKLFDYLLCLFPFEPPYFEKYGLKTSVVGHTAIKNVNGDGKAFLKKHNLKNTDVIITLLPGTRDQMIDKLIPVYTDVVDELYDKIKNLKIVIPTTKGLRFTILEKTKHWKREPIIITDKQDRYDAFDASNLTIAISGTSVLEIAISKTPCVVCYKVSPITYWIAKKFVKIKNVSLPNIIMKKTIFNELIQENCNSEKIVNEVMKILNNKKYKDNMISNLNDFNKKIKTDFKESPSDKAATAVLKLLK